MGWKDKIEDIPYIDKVVNFIIGIILFLVLDPTFAGKVSLIIILVVALLKEAYDWYCEDWENVDLWDTFYVMLGSVLCCLIMI